MLPVHVFDIFIPNMIKGLSSLLKREDKTRKNDEQWSVRLVNIASLT